MANLGPGVWQHGGGSIIRLNDVSYANNDSMAGDLRAITLAAWDGYRFVDGGPPVDVDGSIVEDDLLSKDYTRIKDRINNIVRHGQGAIGGPGQDNREFLIHYPVFITMDEYNFGYVKRDYQEVVFVYLPSPGGPADSADRLGGSVRALMAAVPFGM